MWKDKESHEEHFLLFDYPVRKSKYKIIDLQRENFDILVILIGSTLGLVVEENSLNLSYLVGESKGNTNNE